MGTRNRVGIGLLYRPARAHICKPFKEPRIDSQPGGLVRQPYLLYRLGRFHRLAESIHRNQFLGSLNVYKYGLRLHWLEELVPWNQFLGSLNIYKYGLRLHWLAELVPWNQFLGSLNIYKYGLRLHWLAELVPWNRFLGYITWRKKTKTINLDRNEYIRPSTIKGMKNKEFIRS